MSSEESGCDSQDEGTDVHADIQPSGPVHWDKAPIWDDANVHAVISRTGSSTDLGNYSVGTENKVETRPSGIRYARKRKGCTVCGGPCGGKCPPSQENATVQETGGEEAEGTPKATEEIADTFLRFAMEAKRRKLLDEKAAAELARGPAATAVHTGPVHERPPPCSQGEEEEDHGTAQLR